MTAHRFLVFATAIALGLGCSSQVTSGGTGAEGTGAGTTTCVGPACACGATETGRLGAAQGLDKIDLVLVVDNSASMGDKQAILALAIPDLIASVVNPRCLDNMTHAPVAAQPAGPLDACPAGSTREFPPILDMHVGLLSSSLGTFGATGCPDTPPLGCPGQTGSTSNDDHGHLVTRTDPCSDTSVPTYQGSGFLAWDPAQKLSPPGEANLGDVNTPGLIKSIHDLVVGDGQVGCGFESQNESWYRFLVDPTPYASIALVNNQVQTTGIDTALLAQRKDFLRPDSLLAIVNITDETDTSIKEFSSYPLFASPNLHLPLARSECTTKGPTDPCCASCGEAAPAGCPAAPECVPPNNMYTAATENTSLRAFGLISHKARYGIEFFYQPSRYVAALTSATVSDDNDKTVPNPIFSNLDPANYPGAVRDPSLVLYAAVVGVPWQLIARQKNGVPDLINGVDSIDPTQVGGFKTAAELSLIDPKGNTFWDDIAGNPESYVPAKSPYMQESTIPRTGTDPITGISLSPPGSASGADPINGHERTIAIPAGDIEYACTFPILAPIDCSKGLVPCDCVGAGSADNPLCATNPNDGGNFTMQVAAKAYPGIKHLAIARGMGDQGIVASICAKQVSDPTQPDFGYRPAATAISNRIRQMLRAGAIGGQCLPETLPVNADGQVACSIIEATKVNGACECDPALGRSPIAAADACYQQAAAKDPMNATAGWNCYCEIQQLAGAALASCQSDPVVNANGYCYVDPATNPSPGAAELVANCPAGEKHQIRFVGAGAPAAGSTVFVACH